MSDALNPNPDSTVLTLPSETPSLPNIPEIVQQYLNGESVQVLARQHGVARRTIYNWMHRMIAEPELREVQRQAYVNRIADADDMLESAADAVHIARAREIAKFARWDAERRLPELFGLKTEVKHDKTINVYVNRSTPQQVVVEGRVIEATDVSTQEDREPNT